MNGPAVIASELTREFRTVRAVDRVTFEIPSGVIFGFLGSNGAGKTTTIRLFLGLLAPSSGRAEVLGFDTRANGDRIRERTGALLEHTGLYERLTAEENLDFYGRACRMRHAERTARARELLVHLSLWDRRRERVDTWSRGMKQKLAVARALLHRPRLIFLDEPTAGLDPVAAAALRDDLANLTANDGCTVFLTTHNLMEAERLCALVGVINRGKLLAVGRPDELRARSGGDRMEISGTGLTGHMAEMLKSRGLVQEARLAGDRLTLSLSPGSPAAPVVKMLVGEGAGIEEVRKGATNLEAAFLTIMREEEEHRS